MEREAEEAALAAREDDRVDVEERRAEERAVLHDPDDPALLDDEDPRGVAGGEGEVGGLGDALDEELGLERRLGAGGLGAEREADGGETGEEE